MNKKELAHFMARIEKGFKSGKMKFVGDLQINDEEYDMLKSYIKSIYGKLSSLEIKQNIFLTVAMVQIGIKEYDGSYWPHIADTIGISALSGEEQRIFGQIFYKTLKVYNLCRTSSTEYVNNILLHSFVTDKYAPALFEFLLAYYKIDLERDLSRNTGDMKNYLMESLKKDEVAGRNYQVKRHTSQAVKYNERGCRQRINRILKYIDNALFYDIVPSNSKNRISKLFCEWKEKSTEFKKERTICKRYGYKRGERSFSSPFVRYDTHSESFILVLPKQYIHTDLTIIPDQARWIVDVNNVTESVISNIEESITGFVTEEINGISLNSSVLFSKIELSLDCGNGIPVKKFIIDEDSFRFFDKNWNMLGSLSDRKHLPSGQIFSFSNKHPFPTTGSGKKPFVEEIYGYYLSNIILDEGDVVVFPNGQAKYVGNTPEEGVLTTSFVPEAKVILENEALSVYNEFPSFYFRMRPDQENGTLFEINGNKIRFSDSFCQRFELDEATDEKGYIFHPSDIADNKIINSIVIDVPNSRKENGRFYKFAVINDLKYKFDKSLYMFDKEGYLDISVGQTIGLKESSCKHEMKKKFTITPTLDSVNCTIISNTEEYPLNISVPCLKWKTDENEWKTEIYKDLYLDELPEKIYIDMPDEKLTLFMSPIFTDRNIDIDEDDFFSQEFKKDKISGVFECDTRKIQSWIGREEYKRKLYLTSNSMGDPEVFLTVLTKNKLESLDFVPDFQNKKMTCGSVIHGKWNCKADVFYNDNQIAEKEDVTSRGFSFNCDLKNGKYRIDYYEDEQDEEDEFEFGFENLILFDKREFEFVNPYDITSKKLIISSAKDQNDKNSFFAGASYTFASGLLLYDIVGSDEPCVFFGKCEINHEVINVRLVLSIKGTNHTIIAELQFEDDGYYYYFYFDTVTKTIRKDEIPNLSNAENKKRLIELDENYMFEAREKGE